MYTFSDYGWMVADRVRTDAYTEALKRTVRPGSVVLDVGTGIGIWALLACRFGARRVYAVEPDPVIHVAEQLAAANGYADRITFIRDLSTRITLPEPVDVVVAEIHGGLPQYGRSIATLIDARRFLRPGGTFIPRQESLWLAVVDGQSLYEKQYVAPWGARHYGLDMTVARNLILHSQRAVRMDASELLTDPVRWAMLDYASLETPDTIGEAAFVIERSAIAHGLLVWFDSALTDDVGFSNAPGKDPLIFAQVFFPWLEPIHLEAGDLVAVSMQARLINDDYVWSWNSRVTANGGAERVKASFRQSTFLGEPISLDALKKSAAD